MCGEMIRSIRALSYPQNCLFYGSIDLDSELSLGMLRSSTSAFQQLRFLSTWLDPKTSFLHQTYSDFYGAGVLNCWYNSDFVGF